MNDDSVRVWHLHRFFRNSGFFSNCRRAAAAALNRAVGRSENSEGGGASNNVVVVRDHSSQQRGRWGHKMAIFADLQYYLC